MKLIISHVFKVFSIIGLITMNVTDLLKAFDTIIHTNTHTNTHTHTHAGVYRDTCEASTYLNYK